MESIVSSLPTLESELSLNRTDWLGLAGFPVLVALLELGTPLRLGLIAVFVLLGVRAVLAIYLSLSITILFSLTSFGLYMALLWWPWMRQSLRDAAHAKAFLEAFRDLAPGQRSEVAAEARESCPRLTYLLAHARPFRELLSEGAEPLQSARSA